jgi:AraC-like DNA-binding protein
MRFCSADQVPNIDRLCTELARGAARLRSSELIATLINAVIDAGALASDGFERQQNDLAVRRARDLLAAHTEDNLRLDDVAAAAGLNKFALLRQFRRALGTTPHAYAILCRVERARALLARGASAAEAAARAGFADQAHMTRQFKRQFGLTPSAYARTARTTLGLGGGPSPG